MYYFDAHCDYLWKKVKGERSGLINASEHGLKKSVFAVFEGKFPQKENIRAQTVCYNAQKPIESTYIAFEGLSVVDGLGDAEHIARLKPVYVAPVWNNANKLGGSCTDDGALTGFGKVILSYFSAQKILIDAAHSGEKMFFSLCDNFENVIFSHGNAKEICACKRNLTREQIELLIRRNSFLGLTFYPAFVGGESIEKLFEHIEYILSLGGEDILGFGSDIDGCETLVGGKTDASVFSLVTEEMRKRNYSSCLIEKLSHLNLERNIEKTSAFCSSPKN